MSDFEKSEIWHPQADIDVTIIKRRNLTLSGRNSAERISKKIMDTAAFLGNNPYAAALSRFPKLRKKRYRAFPVDSTYIMLYKVENGRAVIYRIVDGRTNYSAWVE